MKVKGKLLSRVRLVASHILIVFVKNINIRYLLGKDKKAKTADTTIIILILLELEFI